MEKLDDKNSAVSAIFSKKEWEKDKLARFDLDELNNSFYESVPSLKYLKWRIKEISRGSAKTILPLNITSTNQYITTQAALMLLAADYTGGIALSTLFHMVPIIGFHPMSTDYGAYMWGAKASIKWICPSCSDLICCAEVPFDNWIRIAKRFSIGKRVIETLPIGMFNGDKIVAQAEFTYWAQNSYSLRSNAFDEKRVHILFDHQYKSSAKLIAGLRALEQMKPSNVRLFYDPYASEAAGNHGVTLAKRFCKYMPQLQPMVSSRTKNLDDLLIHLDGNWNIVNIGVGFDTRPWRLELRNHHFFELDLPLMLSARKNTLPDKKCAKSLVTRLPIDLRIQKIDDVLLTCTNFDKTKPIFFIWEGGSMYFNEDDTKRILGSISSMLIHEKSRIWFDFVSKKVIDNKTGFATVEQFIRGMRKMGEPFIMGYGEIEKELKEYELALEHLDYSNIYINSQDPIFKHYAFCVSKKLV